MPHHQERNLALFTLHPNANTSPWITDARYKVFSGLHHLLAGDATPKPGALSLMAFRYAVCHAVASDVCGPRSMVASMTT